MQNKEVHSKKNSSFKALTAIAVISTIALYTFLENNPGIPILHRFLLSMPCLLGWGGWLILAQRIANER